MKSLSRVFHISLTEPEKKWTLRLTSVFTQNLVFVVCYLGGSVLVFFLLWGVCFFVLGVLAKLHGMWDLSSWQGASALGAPCCGNRESEPLGLQGSPRVQFCHHLPSCWPSDVSSSPDVWLQLTQKQCLHHRLEWLSTVEPIQEVFFNSFLRRCFFFQCS